MEEITVSKMQAVELAKAIVEARDAELAFLLQVQEIMKSTSNLPEHEVLGAGDEDLELDPPQQLLDFVKLEEETQLSLLEAARLAHLDAIQEHDAHFARSLANMPRRDWERSGCNMADPFTAPSGSHDPFLNEVDEFDTVPSRLGDYVRSRGGGMHPAVNEVIRAMQGVRQRPKLSMTPLTSGGSITPRSLSLLETARPAHLDAIQEHDAHFARSLANMPRRDWERSGCNMADPFTAPSGSHDPFLNEVDEFDTVPSRLGDCVRSRGGGMHPAVNEVIRAMQGVRQRPKLSMTPLTSGGSITSRRCLLDPKQQGKGKEKVVLQDDDGDSFPANSSLSSDSLSTKTCTPLNIAGLSLQHGATEMDMNAGDSGLQFCQICFEATEMTSTFVTLEGCGHQFCATCVTRHAEARILDGGHVTCLHAECPALISYTQLSSLLSSALLEVLTQRQIEAAIPDTERMYCPFRDCSALLMKPASSDSEKPSSSAHPPPAAASSGCVECAACHRGFCLECMVPWHDDMSCGEFQANLKNLRHLGDEKLLQLADQQKWQRCGQCGRFVELSSGCFHMTCLCKNEFCYTCGESWRGGGKTCSCPRWSESRL